MKIIKKVFYRDKNKIIKLIDSKGQKIGFFKLEKALEISNKKNLDLVEINSNSITPICRIINYNKFVYIKKKNIKIQKRKNKIIEFKEIKFSINIEIKDYKIKLKKIKKFLKKNKKIKIIINFRGREKKYLQNGIKILDKIKNKFNKISITENFPNRLEGNRMIMILSSKIE